MLKKLLVLSTLLTSLCVVTSALAAPLSSSNARLLSIKQTSATTFLNTVPPIQHASISMTTTASDASHYLSVVRNSYGAIPIDEALLGPTGTLFPFIPAFDYHAMWGSLSALNACEASLRDKFDTMVSALSWDDYYYYAYLYESGYTAKKASTDLMLTGAASAPYNFTPTPTECPLTNTPMMQVAAAVKNGVGDYSQDSTEAIDFATAYHMNTLGRANALKSAVISYINANNIEMAFVDVEFGVVMEAAMPQTTKRVAVSFLVNRRDTLATPGMYLGATVIPPPNADPAVVDPNDIRNNTIDIAFDVYREYGDLAENLAYLDLNRPIVTAKTFPYAHKRGRLQWQINRINGASSGTVSNAICNDTDACDKTAGKGYKDTRGAYDPKMAKDAGTGYPTIEDVFALHNVTGLDCLITSSGSCSMDGQNVRSLMRFSNAITGTLTYTGRWELTRDAATTNEKPKSRVTETSRGVIMNVCQPLKLKNQIDVKYTVRRLEKTFDLSYSASTVHSVEKTSSWKYTEIDLPNAHHYTLAAGVPLSRLHTVSPYLPTCTAGSCPPADNDPNFAASLLWIKLPGEGAGAITPVVPDFEGWMMLNPLLPAATGQLISYRTLGTTIPRYQTWEPYMVGVPKYLTSSVEVSSSLPTLSTPSKQTIAVVESRDQHFDCKDMNEPQYKLLKGQENSSSLQGWDHLSFQPSGLVPNSTRSFHTFDYGSATITDAGSLDNMTCEMIYSDWSDISPQVNVHYTLQNQCWQNDGPPALPAQASHMMPGSAAVYACTKPAPGTCTTSELTMTQAQVNPYSATYQPACGLSAGVAATDVVSDGTLTGTKTITDPNSTGYPRPWRTYSVPGNPLPSLYPTSPVGSQIKACDEYCELTGSRMGPAPHGKLCARPYP